MTREQIEQAAKAIAEDLTGFAKQAYLAGRASMREEAARLMEDWAIHDAAEEIYSIPIEEAE